MNLQSFKRVLASFTFSLVLVHTDPATAHIASGSLLKSSGARDIHQITCPDEGARLEVQVRDNKPVKSPVINVLVEKGTQSQSAFDKRDGDQKASPLIVFEGGAGDYIVTVYKTAKSEAKQAKKEIYTLIYHCLVGFQHTDTNRVYLENE